MSKFEIGNLVFFEPENTLDFEPFCIMHPLWEMRIGSFRIFEKYLKLLNNPDMFFQGRSMQLNSFLKRFGFSNSGFTKKNTLIIDSSVIPNRELFENLELHYSNNNLENEFSKTVIFNHLGIPFALFVPADEIINPQNDDHLFLLKYFTDFRGTIKQIEIPEIKKINYVWDTLDICANQINEDFNFYENNQIQFIDKKTNESFINPENIFIGNNVKISPFVAIDASEGKVIIDDNVKIMPHSSIIGPAYIGRNSILKIGTKLYEKSSIGEFCKIGGEIENTIIQSYSNKQHEGFLGHSFICEWVNLGADTNNSDLKNTYGNIKMRLRHKTVDSKRMFLGLMCGDHTKSAINTQFNTGTIAGICGILFDSGFLKTSIPSFSWGGGNTNKTYLKENAIETAKIVLSRRNKELLSEEIDIIINEYESVTKSH